MKNTLKLLLLFLFLQNFGGELLAQEPGKHQFIVYDDPNFGGNSKTYNASQLSGNFFTDRWNNRISSIKVGVGIQLTLFDRPTGGLDGAKRMVMFRGGLDNLRRFDDKAKSYKIKKVKENIPLVAFYDRGKRRGTYQTLGPGKWNYDDLLADDAISGVEASKGTIVHLYDDANYQGNKATIKGDGRFQNVNDRAMFDNRTSSIEVIDLGYKIIKVEKGSFREMTPMKDWKERGTNVTSRNSTNREQPAVNLILELAYSSSITTNWKNAITAGISVSTEITVSGDAGFAEVESKTSISAHVEDTYEWGEEETKTKNAIYKIVVPVSVKIGGRTMGEVFAKQARRAYTITYTYAPVIYNDNGTFTLLKTNHKIIKEDVIVDEVFSFLTDTYDIDDSGIRIDYPTKNNIDTNTSTSGTKIGSTGIGLASANNNLYTVKKDGSIFKYNGTPNSWSKIGGYCSKLVSTNDILYNMETNGSIFKYVNNQWIKIGGYAKDIATNNDDFYYLKNEGSIFKYNGTGSSYTKIGGYCSKLVSTNGILYQMAEDGSIFKYVNNQWIKIGGYAKDIATNNGNFYYLKNEGSIFKYNGTGSSYTKIGGYGEPENWTKQIKNFNQNTSFGSNIYYLESSGNIFKK